MSVIFTNLKLYTTSSGWKINICLPEMCVLLTIRLRSLSHDIVSLRMDKEETFCLLEYMIMS